MDTLGERINILIKRLGTNKKVFANAIGVSPNTVGSWTNRGVKMQPKVMMSIVNTFNVNPEWLENGTGDMFLEDEKNNIPPELAAVVGLLKEYPKEVQNWAFIHLKKKLKKF